MERERKEKEKKERLERERKERERIEKERQEKLEQERLEKERKEKEKKEKRERKEKEKQEKLEQERLEKERKEKERQEKAKLKEIEFLQTEPSIFKHAKQNYSLDIDQSPKSGFNKKKFSRFGAQSPDDVSSNREEKPIKKIYVNRGYDHFLGEPKKEEYRIEIPKKNKLFEKKKMNIQIDDDNSSQQISEEGAYTKYNKKTKKLKEKGEDYNKRFLTIKDSEILKSNLSESFLKGTKIKIFKCVVWKNLDPKINEDTIRLFLRRSGSQLLKNGGFIMKLPQKKKEYKTNISLI